MFSNVTKVLLYLLVLLSTYSSAYPQYNNNVPNGNLIPPSALELGHPGGATKRYTQFANQYVSSGRKWTRDLCMDDADGDGQSNGLEMGDPCCKWVQGSAPLFTTGLSDPNNSNSMTKNSNITCV